MKYGYARVSTDGQSVEAQVRRLTKAGCKKVFREVASGAKPDRAQLLRHSFRFDTRLGLWLAHMPSSPLGALATAGGARVCASLWGAR
jgi:hypothetical protein